MPFVQSQIVSCFADEFDAEDVKGSWGSKKKYFYGGNPNEKFKRSGAKNIEEDENELVRPTALSLFLFISLSLSIHLSLPQ